MKKERFLDITIELETLKPISNDLLRKVFHLPMKDVRDPRKTSNQIRKIGSCVGTFSLYDLEESKTFKSIKVNGRLRNIPLFGVTLYEILVNNIFINIKTDTGIVKGVSLARGVRYSSPKGPVKNDNEKEIITKIKLYKSFLKSRKHPSPHNFRKLLKTLALDKGLKYLEANAKFNFRDMGITPYTKEEISNILGGSYSCLDITWKIPKTRKEHEDAVVWLMKVRIRELKEKLIQLKKINREASFYLYEMSIDAKTMTIHLRTPYGHVFDVVKFIQNYKSRVSQIIKHFLDINEVNPFKSILSEGDHSSIWGFADPIVEIKMISGREIIENNEDEKEFDLAGND